MARIIYSALVESIRGSIGGTTFQSNKYGFTVKRRPNMTIPNSPMQNERKRVFAIAARGWRDLTDALRADWEAYASTYPQYAKHNAETQLNGFNLWMRVMPLRLIAGTGYIAPVELDLPASVTLSYTATYAASVLRIDVDCSNELEEWSIMLFISRPLSSTKNFVGSATRYIAVTTSATYSNNISAAYYAVFGQYPAVDDRIALTTVVLAYDYPYVVSPTTEILVVEAPA